MSQRADHPHYAAYHLVKSLDCCHQCGQASQRDYSQLLQLEQKKEALANQLKRLNSLGGPSVETLRSQVHQLQQLIIRLRGQNDASYKLGMQQIDGLIIQKKRYEQQIKQGMHKQLLLQISRNRQLGRQVQDLMQKIRQLHRINNQLIHNFCSY